MGTVPGLDSATPPDAATARAMYNGGIRIYGGYLPTGGEAVAWTQADFEIIRNAGMEPIAYYFGVANVKQVIADAKAWGVKIVMFDEEGWGEAAISPDLAAVRAAGSLLAGLYAHPSVLDAHRGEYDRCVAASYTANGQDPHTNIAPGYTPTAPAGWQWEGTHTEFGHSVDRGTYDSKFIQGGPLMSLTDAEQTELLDKTRAIFTALQFTPGDLAGDVGDVHNAIGRDPHGPNAGQPVYLASQLDAIQAQLNATPAGDAGAILTGIKAEVDRLLAELHTP